MALAKRADGELREVVGLVTRSREQQRAEASPSNDEEAKSMAVARCFMDHFHELTLLAIRLKAGSDFFSAFDAGAMETYEGIVLNLGQCMSVDSQRLADLIAQIDLGMFAAREGNRP